MLAENHNSTEVLKKYRNRLMMLGEKISVLGAASYEATAIDIDDSGHLIVRKDDGEVLVLSSGEISIVTLKQFIG